jgi:hypothetical protein
MKPTPLLLTALCLACRAIPPRGVILLRPHVFLETPGRNQIRFGPVGMASTDPARLHHAHQEHRGRLARRRHRQTQTRPDHRIHQRPKLKDIDPRIQLGNIITAAEATDGVLKFAIKGEAEPEGRQDPRARRLQQNLAARLPEVRQNRPQLRRLPRQPGSPTKASPTSACCSCCPPARKADLAAVRDGSRGHRSPTSGYAWHIGYGGSRSANTTSAPATRPCSPSSKAGSTAAKGEYNDGWAGRGGVTPLGYGNGHLNAAGTAVVTFLLLAKECGAEVPDDSLLRARSPTSTATPAAATQPLRRRPPGNRLRGQRQERQPRLRHGRRRRAHPRWRKSVYAAPATPMTSSPSTPPASCSTATPAAASAKSGAAPP